MADYLNVCRFTPTLGGTTDWTYSAAVTGYQSPTAAGAVNGTVYRYRAESADLTQWEIGYGAYNSGTGVFARTTVLFNSSGTTSKISFSTVPQVAIVALAEDVPSLSKSSNNFTGDITTAAHGFFNLGVIGGTSTNAILALASTSSGAPSGDRIDLTASTVNVNGVLGGTAFGAWTTFTPAFTFTGGTTPAYVDAGSAYRLEGKKLFYRVCGQITYASVPSVVRWTLPASLSAAGNQIVYGLNISSLSFLFSRMNASGAADIYQAGGAAAASASGQFIVMTGVIEVQ